MHHLEYLLHAIEWIHDRTIQSPATNLFLMHTFFCNRAATTLSANSSELLALDLVMIRHVAGLVFLLNLAFRGCSSTRFETNRFLASNA